MDNIIFSGISLETGQKVYGGFYQWNDRAYIVQKDIWELEDIAQLIEIDPNTFKNESTITPTEATIG